MRYGFAILDTDRMDTICLCSPCGLGIRRTTGITKRMRDRPSSGAALKVREARPELSVADGFGRADDLQHGNRPFRAILGA